jgi:putative ATP-dependent endonuclease of the OLD family
MIIATLRVERFSCIYDETLPCEPLTALVGPNGCGKSSFLRALALFYSPSPRFTAEDFYNRDTSKPIRITVTFTGLNRTACELFSDYIEGDSLTITKIMAYTGDKPYVQYHGWLPQNIHCAEVRQTISAADMRVKYSELRKSEQFNMLPSATTREAILSALKAWEQDHPSACNRQLDDGHFFGFHATAAGQLGRFTRFIHVPAVRDAGDDVSEGKGSAIAELLDLVVRRALANRQDIKELERLVLERYEEITNPSNLSELNQLQGRLTETLQTYVPDAGVELAWQKAAGFTLPVPRAQVRLSEHGYAAGVSHTGHGLQRSFILTMLQHLTASQVAQTAPDDERLAGEGRPATTDLPDLVLAIEEPELYQHPSRQRHLASVMLRLAGSAIPGVFSQMQVLYGTHSPLFVGLDRFDQVRVLRKVSPSLEQPGITKVSCVSGDVVADELWRATGIDASNIGEPLQYTWQTLRPRLRSIMTPWMGEGFFADVVVLVEGEEDRSAIVGTARALEYDFDSAGICVLPCGGKNSLDRPLVIFRRFGIPTYVIWDGDHGLKDARVTDNHRLLRLVGRPVQDFPETTIAETFACFRINITETIRDEVGTELFDDVLEKCRQEDMVARRNDAMKNPYFVERLFATAADSGARLASMESIVKRIIALKS